MTNSKTLTFQHNSTKKNVVVEFVEGICKTPEMLAKVIADTAAYTWASIESTGNTLSHLNYRKAKKVWR